MWVGGRLKSHKGKRKGEISYGEFNMKAGAGLQMQIRYLHLSGGNAKSFGASFLGGF